VLAPFTPQPSWNAYLARASDGLSYGLPLAAGGAAWTARRFAPRRIGTQMVVLRSSLRVFWSQTWVLFAAVATGYALTLICEIVAVSPIAGGANLWVLVTFLGMAAGAVGIGYILGAYAPLPLALPLAVFGTFEWVAFPQMDGVNTWWRNITGYSLYSCCDRFALVPDPRAIGAPLLIAAAVASAAVMCVKVRWTRLAIPSVLALAIALLLANAIVYGTAPTAGAARPASDLHCEGDSPTVCFLPEEWKLGGSKDVEHTIRDAYAHAIGNGLTLPPIVTTVAEFKRSDSVFLQMPFV